MTSLTELGYSYSSCLLAMENILRTRVKQIAEEQGLDLNAAAWMVYQWLKDQTIASTRVEAAVEQAWEKNK